MNGDEWVRDGVLGYYFRDEFVPYTAEQLTKFLLRAEKQIDRLIKQQLGESYD